MEGEEPVEVAGDDGQGSSRTDQLTGPKSPQSDPNDVLAERFARGEIDEKEFYKRRELLGGWCLSRVGDPVGMVGAEE